MSTEPSTSRLAYVGAIADSIAADWVDEDGRPLGELASPAYDPARTEVVACPYAGSRQGLPMNRSALRQLASCWPELLASARALAGPRATVHRAWRAALAGVVAPLLGPRPVPRVGSALYKTSLGFTQILTGILLSDDLADVPLAALGDGPAFLDLLETGRWLVGDVQVCAGPPGHLVAMFEALCGSREAPPADLPDGIEAAADLATEVVALQCAAIGFTYAALRRGDRTGLQGTTLARWFETPRSPCLRAMLAVPGRPASHVRRLFPAGRVPDRVETFLAAGDARPDQLQSRLDRALAG